MKYLLALLPALAFAGGNEHQTPSPSQTQGQLQGQSQEQHLSQSQVATSAATASASPVSNASTNATLSASPTANSGGNAQTVVTERSAPPLAQGSFAIQGCGVAGNMGHSSTGGASFLGFGFTPEQCYDFQLAQAYAAMGAVSTACAVLNASRAGQRAKKRGIPLPVCEAPIAAPVSQHVQPPPPVVINVEPSPPPACARQCRKDFLSP